MTATGGGGGVEAGGAVGGGAGGGGAGGGRHSTPSRSPFSFLRFHLCAWGLPAVRVCVPARMCARVCSTTLPLRADPPRHDVFVMPRICRAGARQVSVVVLARLDLFESSVDLRGDLSPLNLAW